MRGRGWRSARSTKTTHMLDAYMRRIVDPPLDRIGRRLAAAGISANAVTVGGFAVGLLAIPFLAVEWY